jgi:hypothetical protein
LKTLIFAVAAITLAGGQASFADEFAGLKCGVDIPKAMIGKRSTNDKVMALEKKYAAIGLKDLGGDMISDDLNSVNWTICGSEYIELVNRKNVVSDVLPLPPHSKAMPGFSGMCQLNGKDLPDVIIAVLDGSSGNKMLPVKSAWKIDQKQGKFVALPGEGLLCPKDSVYPSDGGHS